MEDDRVHPQPSLLSVSMKSLCQSGGTLADAFIIASVCRTMLGIKGLWYPLWDSKDIWLICGTHQFSGGAAGETRYLGKLFFFFFFFFFVFHHPEENTVSLGTLCCGVIRVKRMPCVYLAFFPPKCFQLFAFIVLVKGRSFFFLKKTCWINP